MNASEGSIEPKTIRPADRKVFAGSRDFGIEIRTRIQEALNEGRSVVLDLGGVEDMTPSFADECFGKLSEELGTDVTERAIRVVNGDQFRSLISAVTRIRLQRAVSAGQGKRK